MKKPMSFEQIEAFVKRVTYKPGATIYVDRPLFENDRQWPCVKFLVVMEVPDAEPPHTMTTVHREAIMPLEIIRDEPELTRHLYRLLQGMEMHEVDEWFKVDGAAPFYPHTKEEQLEARSLSASATRLDGDAPPVKVPAAPEAGARNDGGRAHSPRRR